jgi:hypothetical protein
LGGPEWFCITPDFGVATVLLNEGEFLCGCG